MYCLCYRHLRAYAGFWYYLPWVEAFRSQNKIWLCYFFVHFYGLFSSATDQYELVLLVMQWNVPQAKQWWNPDKANSFIAKYNLKAIGLCISSGVEGRDFKVLYGVTVFVF